MTERGDAFAATVDETMRVREGTWDGARGERESFDWATRDDGTVDWEKVSVCFGVSDLNPLAGENITRASFKLCVTYIEDGEPVAIGNAIRNALARLPQTDAEAADDLQLDGLSDAVRAEVKGRFERMLARLNEQTGRDVERSEEERAQIREEFPRYITATPSQMREWSKSPFAGENRKEGAARESARDALRRVIALKEKPMSEWTEGDYDDAVKAIAFVKRMSEVEQGDPIVIEGREGPSERDASLRDWGHWTDAAADAEHRQALADMAAAGRLLRWSRIECTVDAKTIAAINRAAAVADRLAARGDAGTIKAIAEDLRTDGLDDYLTADGFLRIKVKASRTGSQRYSDGVSTWWEYRSAEEVGSHETLSSWGLKPFTDDHPPVMVTPSTYTEYARGSCGQDAVLLEQPEADGERYTELTVLVGDIATLEKIRKGLAEQAAGVSSERRVGKIELSAGYTMIPVADDGVDPNTGVRYQYRQTKIRINHLALVDRGRAGPLARFSVDGAAYEIEDKTMTKTAKDQMDPEQAKQLLMTVAAYCMPASPEAAAASLSQLAAMTGLDPAMISTILAPSGEGEGEGMMDMEIAPGIVVKATADAKAKWAARKTADADLASKLEALTADTAALRGQLKVALRTIDRLSESNDEAARDALAAEIAAVCPQLAKSWDSLKSERKWFTADATGKRSYALSMTDMQALAIVDLDPGLAADIESERGSEGFDRFVASMYRATIKGAQRRAKDNGREPANDGATNPRGGNVITLDALQKAMRKSIGRE